MRVTGDMLWSDRGRYCLSNRTRDLPETFWARNHETPPSAGKSIRSGECSPFFSALSPSLSIRFTLQLHSAVSGEAPRTQKFRFSLSMYLWWSLCLSLSYLSLNREGRWGTTNDFETSFLHFSLFSTALWDLSNSRAVQSLMLSSHLYLCLPCFLPPFTVPFKMVLARPGERET